MNECVSTGGDCVHPSGTTQWSQQTIICRRERRKRALTCPKLSSVVGRKKGTANLKGRGDRSGHTRWSEKVYEQAGLYACRYTCPHSLTTHVLGPSSCLRSEAWMDGCRARKRSGTGGGPPVLSRSGLASSLHRRATRVRVIEREKVSLPLLVGEKEKG
mmetsp:Transcript_46437/g.91643  ORF Transcript_46437/g.91643 Transcript_46437/m.91643 type:complete len:159 (+) Transcript_46437:206-682(+)